MPNRGFSVGQALAVGGGTPTAGSFIQGVGEGFARQAPGISQALQRKREYTTLSDLEKLENAVPASEQMLINDFRKNMDEMTETQRQEAVVSLQKKLGDDGDKLLLYWVNRAGEAAPKTLQTEIAKQYYPQVTQAMLGKTPGQEYQLRLGELPVGEREEALKGRLAPLEELQPGITERTTPFITKGEEGVLDPETAARQRVEEATTEGRRTGDLQKALEKMELGVKLPWEQQTLLDTMLDTEVVKQVVYDAAVTYINRKKAPEWADELPEAMWKEVFGIDRDAQDNIINAVQEVTSKETAADEMKKGISQVNARAVFKVDMPIEKIETEFTPNERDVIYAAAFGKQALKEGDLDIVNTAKKASRFSADMLYIMDNPVSEFDLTGIKEGKRQGVFLEYVYKLVVALQSIRAAAAALTLGMDVRLTQAARTF